MTVPDVGARAFVITPGQPAVMLTRDAPGANDPATLISDDAGGCRVYLGSDGGVTASNGVPLDAGTSLPWSTDGQLWAIADVAGTAPASVRITRAIDDWQVSPVAIAALAAAALAAKGIPNVLTSAPVASSQLLDSGNVQLFDVSQFASLDISWFSGGILDALISYQFTASDGTIADTDSLFVPHGTSRRRSVRLAVVGSFLTLINAGPGQLHYTIIGTNRAALKRLDVQQSVGVIMLDSANPVAAGDNPYAFGSQLTSAPQGLCTIQFSKSSGVSTGYWSMIDGAGTKLPICETNELPASSPSASGGALVKQIVVPPGVQFVYTCTGAVGGVASLKIANA